MKEMEIYTRQEASILLKLGAKVDECEYGYEAMITTIQMHEFELNNPLCMVCEKSNRDAIYFYKMISKIDSYENFMNDLQDLRKELKEEIK